MDGGCSQLSAAFSAGQRPVSYHIQSSFGAQEKGGRVSWEEVISSLRVSASVPQHCPSILVDGHYHQTLAVYLLMEVPVGTKSRMTITSYQYAEWFRKLYSSQQLLTYYSFHTVEWINLVIEPNYVRAFLRAK